MNGELLQLQSPRKCDSDTYCGKNELLLEQLNLVLINFIIFAQTVYGCDSVCVSLVKMFNSAPNVM